MWVNEERVDLEVQVRNLGDYEARSVDYWSMSYWASIEVGGKYSDLARTVCLNIVDFKLFPGTKVHSEFQILEVTDHFPLTDKLDIHFFELPKLTEEVDLNDDMSLWLALFNANSEEELIALETSGGEVMQEAVVAYRQVTATDRFKELERMRMEARRNEASALDYARREERKLANAEFNIVIEEKDAAIEEKDAAIEEKDAQLAQAADEIARLRAQIGI